MPNDEAPLTLGGIVVTSEEWRLLVYEVAKAIGGKVGAPGARKGRRRGRRGGGSGEGILSPRYDPTKIEAETSTKIYVITAPGHPLKIGIAKEPEKRRGELQTGFPHRLSVWFTLEVPASMARAIERECHQRLSHCRLKGEWFDATVEEAIVTIELTAKSRQSVAGDAELIAAE